MSKKLKIIRWIVLGIVLWICLSHLFGVYTENRGEWNFVEHEDYHYDEKNQGGYLVYRCSISPDNKQYLNASNVSRELYNSIRNEKLRGKWTEIHIGAKIKKIGYNYWEIRDDYKRYIIFDHSEYGELRIEQWFYKYDTFTQVSRKNHGGDEAPIYQYGDELRNGYQYCFVPLLCIIFPLISIPIYKFHYKKKAKLKSIFSVFIIVSILIGTIIIISALLRFEYSYSKDEHLDGYIKWRVEREFKTLNPDFYDFLQHYITKVFLYFGIWFYLAFAIYWGRKPIIKYSNIPIYWGGKPIIKYSKIPITLVGMICTIISDIEALTLKPYGEEDNLLGFFESHGMFIPILVFTIIGLAIFIFTIVVFFITCKQTSQKEKIGFLFLILIQGLLFIPILYRIMNPIDI